MQSSCQFLDAVKSKYGLASDYAVAKKLRISQPTVSRYRKKQGYLDDEVALRVAKALEIDAAYVLACAHAERAKGEEMRATWSRIAEKLGAVAATVFIGVAGYTVPLPQAHSATSVMLEDVYYVK